MLIATMNPCPCGYLTDPTKTCTCTTAQIESYRKRLSGPILDRIDLIINVDKVDQSSLLSTLSHVKNTTTDTPTCTKVKSVTQNNVKNTKTDPKTHQNPLQQKLNDVKNTITDVPRPESEHEKIKRQISRAIVIQHERYQNQTKYNSDLSSQDIPNYVKITQTGQKFLQQAVISLDLSARSYFKLLKIARTIADLDASTEVEAEHISEAISLRQQLS